MSAWRGHSCKEICVVLYNNYICTHYRLILINFTYQVCPGGVVGVHSHLFRVGHSSLSSVAASEAEGGDSGVGISGARGAKGRRGHREEGSTHELMGNE